MKDFDNFFPFVQPHGLHHHHDTHPRNEFFLRPDCCNDAFRAIEELSQKTSEYEVLTIPVHPGLTLIRKRKMQIS
jgi:hypothetical protein